MEAKILELRRSERKKFSVSHFVFGRISEKSVLTEESEKNLFVCCGLPFLYTTLVAGAGVCRECLLFVEVLFSLLYLC